MRKSYIFILILFLLPLSMVAQMPLLRNFTPQEYKGGTQNWGIDQQSDGSLLFANNNGLILFDGDSWASYQVPNFTNVRAVYYEQSSDRIYVGATNEFL